MNELPKDQIRIERHGDFVLAGLWEEDGYIHWKQYHSSELPNDLVSLDDLERFGINVIDMQSGVSKE